MNFVFDIDGTICFDYKNLNKDAIWLLDRLKENGHQIIFASARPIRDLLPVLEEKYYGELLIGANGSMAYQKDRLNKALLFDQDVADRVIEILDKRGSIYTVDSTWDYAYNGSGGHRLMDFVNSGQLAKRKNYRDLPNVMKITVLEDRDMDALERFFRKNNLHTWMHPRAKTLDLLPEHSNKYEALKKLGITDYIAMGNDVNDREMLENASVSVMVDYHEELVDISDKQIASDDHYRKHLERIFANYL